MKKLGATGQANRMSDAAVRAKTGRAWAEWFAVLDAAGARKMSHREIVALLRQEHGVGPWWQQMVTVAYEQACGLRDKHQKPDGYEISVSRTVAVPVAELFAAWADAKRRVRWLAETGLVVCKATASKSMRLTWVDGRSSLEVAFYPKGATKSQVTVQHGKLADAGDAARMKTYWAAVLDRLKDVLDPG